MKIEKFASEINQHSEDGLNTLPVLSLLMILIPFLLLTTVFVDTTVFELNLPVKNKAKSTDNIVVPPAAPGLFIFIDEKGLRTGVGGVISKYFDSRDLASQLNLLKRKFSKRSDITLISSPRIKYQMIIDIITLSHLNGFSQISVADEENFFKSKPAVNQEI